MLEAYLQTKSESGDSFLTERVEIIDDGARVTASGHLDGRIFTTPYKAKVNGRWQRVKAFRNRQGGMYFVGAKPIATAYLIITGER